MVWVRAMGHPRADEMWGIVECEGEASGCVSRPRSDDADPGPGSNQSHFMTQESTMAKVQCVNGRNPISKDVERQLFAMSGGHCQRCHRSLFVDVGERSVSVGEMAHIIASSVSGPRGTKVERNSSRESFENLIMLCPTCHTIVDKAPLEYPITLLMSWKKDHESSIQELFSVIRRASRPEVRRDIEKYLLENRAIWSLYGPESEGASDPLSEKVYSWRRKVLEVVIPNNRAMLLVIDKNRHLLELQETIVAEHLRQHIDDFEARHLHGIIDGESLRFPLAANGIFS